MVPSVSTGGLWFIYSYICLCLITEKALDRLFLRVHHRINGHEFEPTPGNSEGLKPGVLLFMGSQRIRNNWATKQQQQQQQQQQHSLKKNMFVLSYCITKIIPLPTQVENIHWCADESLTTSSLETEVRKRKPWCCDCQFLQCKYFHHDCFQDTNMKSLSMWLRRDAYNHLSVVK